MRRKRKRLRVEQNEHDIETEGKPSASDFDANFRCLGRWALVNKLPRHEDTAITERGKRIHKALEDSDVSGLNKSEAITAHRCMYAEGELIHAHNFEGSDTLFEKRFWDVDDALEKLWSAKLDTVHIADRGARLMVDDHKTGWSLPVAIEDNWQVKSQCAIAGDQYDSQEVVGSLIHPHHPDSLYEVAVYKRSELAWILTTVRGFVAKIQEPDQPRTPNPISCRFCPAKRICPEFQAQQKQLAADIADEIEDEGFTAIIRRTPKERGFHLQKLKSLITNTQSLIDQYVQLAENEKKLGNENAITGYMLRRKYDRKIVDEAAALRAVQKELGQDAAREAMAFSLTQLQEYLETERKMSKKNAKLRAEEVLGRLLKFQASKQWLEESRSM